MKAPTVLILRCERSEPRRTHVGQRASAHVLIGSTRSGGRWPSTWVRMLMMTFSPMSMRPSMVAEPICGSSTTLPLAASLSSFGLTAGSCSKTSRPAPAILPSLQHLDQRVLVDDVAARGVDDVGVRLHQRQPPRRQQMEGRRRRGAIDRDDVHAGQHLVEALPIGRLQLVLDRRQHAVAVVVVDRQAEGLGAAGHRGADAAHADDAEPLAPDAAAEHPGRRPAGPFACRRSARWRPRSAGAARPASAPWSCRPCPRSARSACW